MWYKHIESSRLYCHQLTLSDFAELVKKSWNQVYQIAPLVNKVAVDLRLTSKWRG